MIQTPPEILDPSDNDTIRTIKMDTTGDNIVHYVALPSGQASIDPVVFPDPCDLVHKYPFELDEFQKCAVSCVHRNESVLVSAHTSAGKTAIAIYAVSVALKNKSRVVYTSPIKALSNQKYYELQGDFEGDVGLMTGDTTINPNASILVMTTEILRMMLFTGDALIREISWVIYDEVHYMKDPERGVVWEESIILLPDQIHFVFLSATIPNAREFSEWIAKLHSQPCHVVYTEHRPIPLRYFIAPMGDSQLYLVRNADGEINDTAFATACSIAASSASQSSSKGSETFRGGCEVKNGGEQNYGKPSRKAVESHTCQIVLEMLKSELFPMIVFVFSRKECDRIFEALGNQSFNRPEEKALVHQIFDNAISGLEEVDRDLPQITKTLSLVERGIGVHHGGLMPLMKETVELLFGHGLIKILFATETFAMGLNMPSKTVIFSDLYKFDGSKRRLLSSGEYIQMAGRAGRRNKDKFGAVAINYTGETSPPDLKTLMTNAAQPLNSEFRVTYNMLLNLLQTSYMEPKTIMQNSFHQFQMLRELPELRGKLQSCTDLANAIEMTNEEMTAKAFEIENELHQIEEKMREIAFNDTNLLSLITPGRILKVKIFGWCVCASTIQQGQQQQQLQTQTQTQKSKNSDILIIAYAEETKNKRMIKPTSTLTAKPHLIKIPLRDVEDIAISTISASFDSISNEFVRKIMSVVQKNEKDGIAVMEPSKFIKEGKEEYNQLLREQERCFNIKNSLKDVDSVAIDKYKAKRSYLEEAEQLRSKIETLNHLVNQKDLEAMISVLTRLEFIDKEGIVQTKGRVAATITAADEIVLTELLIDGTFADLAPENCVALLTAFVSEENGKDSSPQQNSNSGSNDDAPKELVPAWTQLQRVVQRVATISLECGCDIDVDKFKRGFNSSLFELALLWASGTSFSQLMDTFPTHYEGSIIRTMKRLDELLNQVASAANVLKDKELEEKLKSATKLINRGIVFHTSLYR